LQWCLSAGGRSAGGVRQYAVGAVVVCPVAVGACGGSRQVQCAVGGAGGGSGEFVAAIW